MIVQGINAGICNFIRILILTLVSFYLNNRMGMLCLT